MTLNWRTKRKKNCEKLLFSPLYSEKLYSNALLSKVSRINGYLLRCDHFEMNCEPYFCFEMKHDCPVIGRGKKNGQKIEKSQKTKRLNKRIRNKRRVASSRKKVQKKVVIIVEQAFFCRFCFAFHFRWDLYGTAAQK